MLDWIGVESFSVFIFVLHHTNEKKKKTFGKKDEKSCSLHTQKSHDEDGEHSRGCYRDGGY